MKFVQLDKPHTLRLPTRGRSQGIKMHKKLRSRFIRRTPVSEETPKSNRYSGWWF